MSLVQKRPYFDQPSPTKKRRMDIGAITSIETDNISPSIPRRSSRSGAVAARLERRNIIEVAAAAAVAAARPRHLSLSLTTTPRTPPESTTGSPRVQTQDSPLTSSSSLSSSSPSSTTWKTQSETWLPRINFTTAPSTSTSTSLIRLPSLNEFDLGVEALTRSLGPPHPWRPAPSTPLPSISRSLFEQHHPPSHHHHNSSPQPFYTHESAYSLSSNSINNSNNNNSSNNPRHMPPLQQTLQHIGYPSPPPDSAENRHINKKYTTEEGDFIIYAWHDKKQKWQHICKDFGRLFGRTPERTVQGLQAWYYRMNQHIPVWDADGWLIFDGEDDLEPRHVSIKVRERDQGQRPMTEQLLGLAQRYPERAVTYSWVDPEVKLLSQDWAAKRNSQYQQRKERRRTRDQRRSSRL